MELRDMMNTVARVAQIGFGIPWLVFGVQHFLYAEFVASLVPSYFPAKLFWTYFTGVAMLAAGASFISGRLTYLAAPLLGTMLVLFVLLIHVSTIANEPTAIHWTRALQDLSLAAAAFILGGKLAGRPRHQILYKVGRFCSYLFAFLTILFGVGHFLNLDFLPAMIPAYAPLRIFWVYLAGVAMIAAGVSFFVGRKVRLIALVLGTLMLSINVLNHVPALLSESRSALLLTAAMLDLAITCGVFIFAGSAMYARHDVANNNGNQCSSFSNETSGVTIG